MLNDSLTNMMDAQLTLDQVPINNICRDLSKIEELHSLPKNEYIGVVDQNDLSKTNLYRRTGFNTNDESIMKWDGKTIDTSWYNKNEQILYIKNANQLASLNTIVNSGETFRGKTIKLAANIDLNHKEWTPIGKSVTNDKIGSYIDYYYEVSAVKNGTFSGVFDGNGFYIKGLEITTGIDKFNLFLGLFKSIKNSVMKNIILLDVNLCSDKRYGYFGSLFGYAEQSMFINIFVSGNIAGHHVASLGCISKDCSFINCKNIATLSSFSTHMESSTWLAGFVMQIGFSKDAIRKFGKSKPKIFQRCIQNGTMTIDAKDISSIYSGQLYANCAYNRKEMMPFGFMIDRCEVDDTSSKFKIRNTSENISKGVFFGRKSGNTAPTNFVSGVNEKTDLLCGLIGKTHRDLAVTVRSMTNSTVLNGMVIPGSVNTLESEKNSNTFITKDVSVLSNEDSIVNLEPYFKFIKTVKS